MPPPITSPGGNQSLKFQIHFLLNVCCFCTVVKSKTHKSDRHKRGTVCIQIGHNGKEKAKDSLQCRNS